MSEIWKSYPKNPEYEVSSSGEVRMADGSEAPPPWPDKKGYLVIDFGLTIHRMVAITFLPNPENLPTVNHKNGNKRDNRVDNLEWMSVGDNVRHARDILGVNHGERSAKSRKAKK